MAGAVTAGRDHANTEGTIAFTGPQTHQEHEYANKGVSTGDNCGEQGAVPTGTSSAWNESRALLSRQAVTGKIEAGRPWPTVRKEGHVWDGEPLASQGPHHRWPGLRACPLPCGLPQAHGLPGRSLGSWVALRTGPWREGRSEVRRAAGPRPTHRR